MYFIELVAFLIYSNSFVLPLKENLKFPSGTVLAFSNFFSACGPIDKVGSINLFSNCLLILKLILLYPILVLDKNNLVTVGINQKPDWFRCWNESEARLHGLISFNKCDKDENTTDLLFRIILPTTISAGKSTQRCARARAFPICRWPEMRGCAVSYLRIARSR